MLKGWRTLLFNVTAALPLVLPLVAEILGMDEVKAIVPADWLPYYSLAVALVNMWLRYLTTTPMGRKE